MIDITDKATLQRLLREHDIRPRKHWGQNFLVSKPILQRMLDAANIQSTDVVLEIGGGAGALTQALMERAERVIVVERDPSLCTILHELFDEVDNVEVRCEDARKIDIASLPHEYRIISNLPYSVGLPILRTFFESNHPPTDAFVMLQHEVAARLAARPPQRSLPGATMQTLATVTSLFNIPPEATWPAPKVASTYQSLVPRKEYSLKEREKVIHKMVLGYRHPRKRVLRNLTEDQAEAIALGKKCEITEDTRAHELTDAQWRCIATR